MKNINKLLVIGLISLAACTVSKKHDQVDEKTGYIKHTVGKCETPKRLAKSYKISTEEVFTLNPNLDKTKPKQKLVSGSSVKLLYLKK